MIITMETKKAKVGLVQEIERELINNKLAYRSGDRWIITDGYTDSAAYCFLDDNELLYITAMSNYVYEIKDGLIHYNGAYNGLGKQEILPESIRNIDWYSAVVKSTLGKMPFEAYVILRAKYEQLREKLLAYGEQGTGYLEGIEITRDQLQDVFKGFEPWTYEISETDEDDPFNRKREEGKCSWDYEWEILNFKLGDFITPFIIYLREEKK